MSILQRIRAEQVLKEEGLNLPIKIFHQSDAHTIIGDKQFKLIFPKFMLTYECEKNIDQLFIGLVTTKRKKFLNNFKDAIVINSMRGRLDEIKQKDEEYFRTMAKARFVLCPNGDFVWTYRFFEAIIFKAIPIIEDYCELYSGYNYYMKDDSFEYKNEWVEANLIKIKNEMFWNY